MTDVFRSPRLTLDRARHHIRDFNEVIDRFIAEKPWLPPFVDKDSKPGRDVHKVKFTLPEVLPCILFDAANNLRAVLDQLGYASAVAGNSRSLKAVKFPFSSTKADFENNLKGCKDLPAKIREIFEQRKAYPEGNDTLWAINEIANTNKHLLIKPLVITPLMLFSVATLKGMDGQLMLSAQEDLVSIGIRKNRRSP